MKAESGLTFCRLLVELTLSAGRYTEAYLSRLDVLPLHQEHRRVPRPHYPLQIVGTAEQRNNPTSDR